MRWHERTGGIVEGTAGPGLDGQPVDPTQATERFLLYLHFAVWDSQAAFTTSRYFNALGPADCRLVLVIRDGSPKRIADDLAKLPNHDKCTVLLCRSKAEAQAVFTAWTPPLDPWQDLSRTPYPQSQHDHAALQSFQLLRRMPVRFRDPARGGGAEAKNYVLRRITAPDPP